MPDAPSDYGEAVARAIGRALDEEFLAIVEGRPSPMEERKKARQREIAECQHNWEFHQGFEGGGCSMPHQRICTKCHHSETVEVLIVPKPGWDK